MFGEVDVIVVGSGVIGSTTGYHLANRGARVLLIEQVSTSSNYNIEGTCNYKIFAFMLSCKAINYLLTKFSGCHTHAGSRYVHVVLQWVMVLVNTLGRYSLVPRPTSRPARILTAGV